LADASAFARAPLGYEVIYNSYYDYRRLVLYRGVCCRSPPVLLL
jgi:hypothetical protein